MKSHHYYYQVMGVMAATKTTVCNLVVRGYESMAVATIEFDHVFFSDMKRRLLIAKVLPSGNTARIGLPTPDKGSAHSARICKYTVRGVIRCWHRKELLLTTCIMLMVIIFAQHLLMPSTHTPKLIKFLYKFLLTPNCRSGLQLPAT